MIGRHINRVYRRFGSNYDYAKNIPKDIERKEMNLFTAINSGLDIALQSDKRYNSITQFDTVR